MRVVHVCGDLGTYGAENVLALLLAHLREPDLELVAMTVNRPEFPGARAASDVPLVPIDRQGRRDFGFLARMVAGLRRVRPQIVHTHGHHGKYWGRLAAVLAGVPRIVHTEHNSDFRPPHRVFAWLNRLLHARTAAVVAFDERHAAALAAAEPIPPERIVIVPNGIPQRASDPAQRLRARAALGASPQSRAIVVVGRLFPVKHQALAIEALAKLPEPLRTEATLYLIGDGPDRPALEALARERGLAERVVFMGFRRDARDLVAGADVALVSSRNEAMPLAVIEAMSAGAPVVTTPWAGAETLLAQGTLGVIAAAHTPEAVAAAIASTLDDSDGTARRVEAARSFARREFDIATTARRYARLYRALSVPTRAASVPMTAARS